MAPMTIRDSDYLGRIVYEMLFFALVGILIFNIITSLVVEGYSSVRREMKSQQDILNNQCFVCGISRREYSDLSGTKYQDLPDYDIHKNQTHSFWNYMYFYNHLKAKHHTEYTGAETYVWSLISQHDLSWIPHRSSAAIQAATQDSKSAGDASTVTSATAASFFCLRD